MSKQNNSSTAPRVCLPLGETSLHPELEALLLLILQENRESTEKILEKQTETSERLSILEAYVKRSNEDHSGAIQDVKTRLDSVEVDLITTKASFESRFLQLANVSQSQSCTGDHSNTNTDRQLLESLADKLEAQDRASRKNNVIIRGLVLPKKEMKGEITKFLADKFNYSGPILNVKPLGKEINNHVNMAVLSLESWEAKMHILRSKKKKLANLKDVYIQSDLTDKERNCMYQLRKVARDLQSDRKKIRFAHQRVLVNGKWYKWDENTNSAVICAELSKKTSYRSLFEATHLSSNHSGSPAPNSDPQVLQPPYHFYSYSKTR